MTFKNWNNIVGWAVFIIALVVYMLTLEDTASFWDCAEFIAVSYKLEVPHPPGAPLFLLIGRMFSFLAGSNVEQVGYWINVSSAISSAFTILFLFWTIVLMGRKILKVKIGEESTGQQLALLGAALIGSLAYTFSDSFWWSAVEAEVYALSSFFTAFVVWAVLKWEIINDERKQYQWLILVAYMMGLSIGVHLLNLVTIPALGLIYYFKKFDKVTRKGIIYTLVVSGLIIIIILEGVIPGLPSVAGSFEVFFVNSIGLPFGSGIIFFSIIFLGAIIFGIIYSQKKQMPLLNTALLSFAFIIIGYMSYAIIPIRSNYDPPIDENDPENIVSFVSYLKREQYGSRPLVTGQLFTAQIVDQKKGAPIYYKEGDKYVIGDYKIKNIYDPEHTSFFPRAWSNQPGHPDIYRQELGLKQGEKPTFTDNIKWFFTHQVGYMYMRYFMWNFASRESDVEGAGWISPGEWFKDLPYEIQDNKARNNFLLLPLILGLIGLFFQYKKDSKSFAVTAMLFFLTGLALVLYLNSPAMEPRERDYIYVGSFYAFTFWIGFGVLAIYEGINRFLNKESIAAGLATFMALIVPGIMAAEGWDDHDRSDRYYSVDSARNFLASCEPNAILFTGGDNDTFPLWYVQEVEGFRTDVRVIVLSYFNTDWYVDQMTRQAYDSEPLPFSLTYDDFGKGNNDYLPYVKLIEQPIPAKQFLRLVKEENPQLQRPTAFGSITIVPSNRFWINVDHEKIEDSGLIPEEFKPFIVDRMEWSMKGGGLEKKDLMILDLIAHNNWERPIYFNSTSMNGVKLDLNDYMIQEGLTYRLLPVKKPSPNMEMVNTEVMYKNVMENFAYRELDNPDTYYNENYRNFVMSLRSSMNSLSNALISRNDTVRANEVIDKLLTDIPDEAVPYDYSTSTTIRVLYRLGRNEEAREISKEFGDRLVETLDYMFEEGWNIADERQKRLFMFDQLVRILRSQGEDEMVTSYTGKLESYMQRMNMLDYRNR